MHSPCVGLGIFLSSARCVYLQPLFLDFFFRKTFYQQVLKLLRMRVR